jgi:hypothetical protein
MVRIIYGGLVLGCLLCLAAAAAAQTSGPQTIAYGEGVTGSLTAPGDSAVYSFDGAAGDLVTARAVGLSGDLLPVLALSADTDELIARSDGERLVHRLSQAGRYRLIISGAEDTTGAFALRLDGGPSVDLSAELVLSATVEFSVNDDLRPRVFIVDASPDAHLPLFVAADGGFALSLSAAEGTSIAQYAVSAAHAPGQVAFSLAPGDEGYLLAVTPVDAGRLYVGLGVQVDRALSRPPAPSAEAECMASGVEGGSPVYSGPGADYDVLGILEPDEHLPVIGRRGGVWYAIDYDGAQGWITTRGTIIGGGGCLDVAELDD